MIWFPDPVAFSIGPCDIRWYGLAYVFGMFFSWFYGRQCIKNGYFSAISVKDWDNLMNCLTLGIVVGGRLGYFVLYSVDTFWKNPLEILQIWHPGMAFHGGLLGGVTAIFLYAHRHKVAFLALLDVVAVSTPIGLFLGRIANFINQEHCGRLTDMPWGVVFPMLPDGPRHPCQLYEAGLEGIVLFLILMGIMRCNKRLCHGQLGGMFVILYGVMRLFTECFRMPDGLWHGVTLGQWYSMPGMLLGVVLWGASRKKGH